jgi:hypothetical protein
MVTRSPSRRTSSNPAPQFAIFISGAPPLKFEGPERIVAQLADEAGTVIDIPTFHIFGCDDAFLTSAIALFNVCDQKSARLYDHGLGHIVPRDAENVELLGKILGELIPRVEENNKREEQQKGPVHVRTGSETDEDFEVTDARRESLKKVSAYGGMESMVAM